MKGPEREGRTEGSGEGGSGTLGGKEYGEGTTGGYASDYSYGDLGILGVGALGLGDSDGDGESEGNGDGDGGE